MNFDEFDIVVAINTRLEDEMRNTSDAYLPVIEALNVTELELVEEFAQDNNLIDSERNLSDQFDELISESVIVQYGADDTPAMSESFNNWTDSLCKDGELHGLQYHHYCYVGKYNRS